MPYGYVSQFKSKLCHTLRTGGYRSEEEILGFQGLVKWSVVKVTERRI